MMSCAFADAEPADGDEVEVDCTRRRMGLFVAEGADDRGRAAAHVNELIAYLGPISKHLTEERTALESALIPVTAYIITACVEAFLRYPEMMAAIDAPCRPRRSGAGRGARLPGQHGVPLVDQQLLAARPQGLRDGRPGRGARASAPPR